MESGGSPFLDMLPILQPVFLLVSVLLLISGWRIFTKAGQPGWAAIVPVYNLSVLVAICGKPAWWVVYLFIPGVSAVACIYLAIALAERFGKSGGFAAGLILLPPVFAPLLAFGDAEYREVEEVVPQMPGVQPPPYRSAGR